MIIEQLTNWRRLFTGTAWSKAFAALEALGPDSPDGEIKIEGDDLFLRIGTYPTRESHESLLETHREYLDIQMMLAGSEGMEWHPAAALTVKDPYNADRDVVFYHQPAGSPPVSIVLRPGTFAVFFPPDGHRGALKLDTEPEEVRKAVIKMRLSLVPESFSVR